MFNSFSRQARFRAYLLFLCAIGLVLILLTTSKYGAGVSSDAARNLSTADNLLRHKGFVDLVGAPFVLWPPLYPLVLSSLSLLTGLGTFPVAWYLNVALCVLNIWLAGSLLYRIFEDQPIYAAAGSLILLLSRSMMRIHANVASEPLFMTFLLLYFFAVARYLHENSRSSVWLMFILAGLASLHRYLGVVLFGASLLIIFLRERWPGLLRGVIPLSLSAAPLAAWAVGHNLPISGAFFGPRDLGEMLPLENIGLSLTKILWWFIPRLSFTDPLILHPWIPLLAAALLLVAINRRAQWSVWRSSLSSPYLWPFLLFSIAYFLLLAFTVVTSDHLDLTSDRYYVVILPAVIALALITLDALLLSHLRGPRAVVTYVFPALFLVWLIYPLYSIQAYVRQALVQGEPTNYNIANSANFREMSVVKAARPILDADPQTTVYSNYVNIAWFLFGHPVDVLPFEDANLPRPQRLVALAKYYPDWPPARGYIIWFKPNQYHHIAAPDELVSIANLRLLYEDESGQIFAVEP